MRGILQSTVALLLALVLAFALTALANSLLSLASVDFLSAGAARTLVGSLVVASILLLASLVFWRAQLRSARADLAVQQERTGQAVKALQLLAEYDDLDFDAFLRFCAEGLATASGCHTVVIAFFVPGSTSLLRSASFLSRGEWLDNVDYDIAGTPCRNVLREGSCYVDRDVANRYPDDHMFVEFGLQAYFGCVIVDSVGKPLGLISVMASEPTAADDGMISLLRAFATRISIEINSNNHMQQIAHEKRRAAFTLTAFPEGVIAIDRDSFVVSINNTAASLLGVSSREGVGLATSDLFSVASGHAESIKNGIAQCLAREQVVSLDSIPFEQANSSQFLSLSIFPIIGEREKLYGAILRLKKVDTSTVSSDSSQST